jgi:hypothetical protein
VAAILDEPEDPQDGDARDALLPSDLDHRDAERAAPPRRRRFD